MTTGSSRCHQSSSTASPPPEPARLVLVDELGVALADQALLAEPLDQHAAHLDVPSRVDLVDRDRLRARMITRARPHAVPCPEAVPSAQATAGPSVVVEPAAVVEVDPSGRSETIARPSSAHHGPGRSSELQAGVDPSLVPLARRRSCRHNGPPNTSRTPRAAAHRRRTGRAASPGGHPARWRTAASVSAAIRGRRDEQLAGEVDAGHADDRRPAVAQEPGRDVIERRLDRGWPGSSGASLGVGGQRLHAQCGRIATPGVRAIGGSEAPTSERRLAPRCSSRRRQEGSISNGSASARQSRPAPLPGSPRV